MPHWICGKWGGHHGLSLGHLQCSQNITAEQWHLHKHHLKHLDDKMTTTLKLLITLFESNPSNIVKILDTIEKRLESLIQTYHDVSSHLSNTGWLKVLFTNIFFSSSCSMSMRSPTKTTTSHLISTLLIFSNSMSLTFTTPEMQFSLFKFPFC